jgi:hypothetical protein
MKLAMSLFTVFLATEMSGPSQPAIPYFSNVREVRIAQPDRQNFFVVDQEIWNHARPDLGDLRLYNGDSQAQYALSEQRAETSSEEVEAKILNLGSVKGRTEFDLDTGGLAEYDRIRLRLDAHDFVASASVSGGHAAGKASEVELAPSTLYDFSKEQLGSNFQLKLPPSSFPYLHIRLSPGIFPQQVKGATIWNLREQKAKWVKAGSCAIATTKQKPGQNLTVIACDIPAKVPLARIEFQIEPTQVNFRRVVSVEDSKGEQVASGEITRVRMNRGGRLVISENLTISLAGNYGALTLVINNGDNPPLAIMAVEPLAVERRIYFDPAGNSILKLYYGDAKLPAPDYDYARFFHLDDSPAEAELGASVHNALFTGRPDDRPWSERHTGVLWAAMVLAALALALLAFRGLRAGTSR